MIDLFDYEPDPITQWPLIEELLRAASARTLNYEAFERTSLKILLQDQALPDFWW